VEKARREEYGSLFPRCYSTKARCLCSSGAESFQPADQVSVSKTSQELYSSAELCSSDEVYLVAKTIALCL